MKKVVIIFSLLIIGLLISEVGAITGSIGNARMILRLETGEKMEKSVLVKNVNDVAVGIKVTVTGDLEDYTEIKDSEFTLEPREEKKAYFTIKALEPGTTETKINVEFSPVEEGNGVGLSSTVIVIAEGESQNSVINWFSGNDDEEDEEEGEEITGAFTGINIGSINIVSLGLLSTTVILVLFIVLLVIYSQKTKRPNKPQKRAGKR